METEKKGNVTLFGSEHSPWVCEDWTDSDDRVRGGKSQSYLKCSDDSACFYGTLDIETLGGAGFASQRTTSDDLSLDLSDYVGIQLNIAKGDKKRYTLILKDELLPPKKEDGREQATISYECDFDLPAVAKSDDTKDKTIFIPWKSFTPTYRGKVKKDADPLDTKSIKRISIMMRSFFGTQKGDFSLTISSIEALKKVPKTTQGAACTEDMWQVEDGITKPVDDAQFIHLRIGPRKILQVDLWMHRRSAHLLLGFVSCILVYCAFSAFARRC